MGKPYGIFRVLALHIIIGLLKIFYMMAGIQELDYEEAQYWTWSKHLDIWYYSKPPMIAYLNRLSTSLFGVHEWGVRINAVILSILTAVAVYYLALTLYKSARLAYYSSILLLFFPGFIYVSLYFTTDAPLVLFWVLSCLYFWKAIKEEGKGMKNWLLTTLFVGLGLLSKYALLFFYPVSFLYLLLWQKEKLKDKGYYVFVFLSLLFLIPMLIWNARYDWVGMGHLARLSGFGPETNSGLFGKSGTFNFQKIISRQLEFFGGQLALNLPLLLVLIFRKRYRKIKIFSQEADRFLLFQAGVVFLFFFIFAFFKRVNVNWLLFVYVPVYIVIARIFISRPLSAGIKTSFAVIAFLFFLLFFQPVFSSRGSVLAGVVPGNIDPNKKLQGWSEMAQEADKNRSFINGIDPIILTESHRVASELSFYMKGNPEIYCLPVPWRKRHQFDIWGLPDYESLSGLPVLLVTTDRLENHGWSSPKNNLIHRDSLSTYYKDHQIGTYYYYLYEDIQKVEGIEKFFTGFEDR